MNPYPLSPTLPHFVEATVHMALMMISRCCRLVTAMHASLSHVLLHQNVATLPGHYGLGD